MSKNLKTIDTLKKRERATLLNNGKVVASDQRVVHKNVGAASSCPQGKSICAIHRGEKGITLIALIVTVIILMILAMTSVSLVLRDNLINKAMIARNAYEASAQNEMEQLNYLEANFPGENLVINQYGFYYDRWYICDDFYGENGEGTYRVKFHSDKTVNIYIREKEESLNEGKPHEWVDWSNKVSVHTDSLEYDTKYSGIGTGGTICTVIVESKSPKYAIITNEIPSDIVEYSNKLIKISAENTSFEAQASEDGKSMVIFGKNFIME